MSKRNHITLAPVPAPASEPAPEAAPAEVTKPTIPAFTADSWYRLTIKGLITTKRGKSAVRYALHPRDGAEQISTYCAKAGKKGMADMRWGFERGFYELVDAPSAE